MLRVGGRRLSSLSWRSAQSSSSFVSRNPINGSDPQCIYHPESFPAFLDQIRCETPGFFPSFSIVVKCVKSSFRFVKKVSLVRTPAASRSPAVVVAPFSRSVPWLPASSAFHSLTDTRLPKRRPADKPRRKRASLKPPGPYAWVKHVAGEPIPANQPNEGSVKQRNEKKRMRLKRAFILSEKKKRKAEMQEAKRKKIAKRAERKMAAEARERAWEIRLAELQRLEEEKKNSMA